VTKNDNVESLNWHFPVKLLTHCEHSLSWHKASCYSQWRHKSTHHFSSNTKDVYCSFNGTTSKHRIPFQTSRFPTLVNIEADVGQICAAYLLFTNKKIQIHLFTWFIL